MRSEEFWKWFDEHAAPRLSKVERMSRANTFRKMFEHLDAFDRPVNIVETGCIEEPDNWTGNGCSTILFNEYVTSRVGTVTSIEIDGEKIALAASLCGHVKFHQGDSVDVLRHLAAHRNAPIDLLYLDASHHDWIRESTSQAHHLAELLAIMPLLHENSLVVVDDSVVSVDDYPQNKVIGKGGIVAQYALEIGADLKFLEYQVGFTRMTGTRPVTTGHIEDIINRARRHVEAGDNLAADRLYRLVLIATPPPWNGIARVARGEAAANFARGAHRLRKYGTAVEWFRTALEADPCAAEYRCELAISLVALGALKPAQREASIACEIEPDNPAVWQTLGGVESDLLNDPACIAAYGKQIEAAEKTGDAKVMSDAYLNRATIAMDTKDYATARMLCRKILNLGVRDGDAWHVMAMIEYRLSHHERAVELFDLAIDGGCRKQPLAHWNKALPLEAIGRLKEAGIEKAWNEKEMTVPAIYMPQHRFNKPKWRAQAGPGTVHVHTEAGHGDNISMFRYFPMIAALGLNVHYEADPRMLSLAQRNFPDVTVMPRTKDYPGVVGIKAFDWHIPIGDLPHAFGTDLDTIPWDGPYLKADPKLSAEMAKKLPVKPRKVGLCWSSGIRKDISIWMEKYGRMKSMYFADIEPLLGVYGNRFVSLQVGDGRDEAPNSSVVLDLLSDDPDWDETAALIDNLDLVITVDTGVAHLAGAMGKPTWVMMMRDGASWHFMCHRYGASWNTSSPWYPSVRIFRQHEFNVIDWNGVVEDVAVALRHLASG